MSSHKSTTSSRNVSAITPPQSHCPQPGGAAASLTVSTTDPQQQTPRPHIKPTSPIQPTTPPNGPRAAAPPGVHLHTRKKPVHLPHISRFNQPVILFVTVCTNNRKMILANEQMHVILKHAWSMAHQYHIGLYMIMPDHLHLFCAPAVRNAEKINKWAGYWKRLVSKQLTQYAPIWQRDCWDIQLRHSDHYHEKWEYVRENPVRKGLVSCPEEWPYQGCLNNLLW